MSRLESSRSILGIEQVLPGPQRGATRVALFLPNPLLLVRMQEYLKWCAASAELVLATGDLTPFENES